MVAESTPSGEMATVSSYKNPPSLTAEKSYQQWKNEAKMWQLVTDLDKNQRLYRACNRSPGIKFLTRRVLKFGQMRTYIWFWGHVEFSIDTNFTNLVKDHLPNISAKFG